MKNFLSLFNPKLPVYLVYMLQQVEYEPSKYVEWIRQLVNDNKPFHSVMHRQKLQVTKRARLLLIAVYVVILVEFITTAVFSKSYITVLFTVLTLPISALVVLYIMAYLAHKLIIKPEQERLVSGAKKLFNDHKAIKIAVLGSYGKTTMKELLLTVLSEGKRVSATPGNMNVSVSHARYAQKLHGDEEILIVEFGEGAPGDIVRMTEMLQPDYAVVTGLAPNHLDHYESIEAVANDLLSVYEVVDREKVFVTAESPLLQNYVDDSVVKFSKHEVLGWKVSGIKVNIDSLSFTITKGVRKLTLTSGLVGIHQVASLALVAGLASELGLSDDEIIHGVGKTKPYEHRMQPRLVNGAWLIDDTYNGNLEGIRAGLKYLEAIDGKRKWYVTPGLVDQGEETKNVHKMIGEAIVEANPDIVVLMENSVRPIIQETLQIGKFRGEVRIEQDPLSFYTNIEHVIAAGDVVLMQNDWTDNYN